MTAFAPLPGDPEHVAAGAQAMKAAADEMQRAAQVLRQLGDGASYESVAIDKFQKHAGELADVMTKASTRYMGAADALADYAPQLKASQDRAAQAIVAAKATNVAFAQQQVAGLKVELAKNAASLDPDEFQQTNMLLSHAKQELREQKAAYSHAETEYNDAVHALKAAAGAAAGRIVAADELSELNDGFTDDLRGFKERYLDPVAEKVMKLAEKHLKPFLKLVSEISEILADKMGLLGLMLVVLGGVVFILGVATGNPIVMALGVAMVGAGEVVSVVAAGLEVVSFVCKLGLFLLGDLTFGQLLVAGISAAVAVVFRVPGRKVGMAIVKKGGSSQFAYVIRKYTQASPEVVTRVVKVLVQPAVEGALTQKFNAPAELWHAGDVLIKRGLPGIEGAHTDVSDMSADFSGIDTDRIIAESFSTETPANRGMVCTPGGGGW